MLSDKAYDIIFKIALISLTIIAIFTTIFVTSTMYRSIDNQDSDSVLYSQYTYACNCTQNNSTYCSDTSGCIHAYMDCQKRMCPECFIEDKYEN